MGHTAPRRTCAILIGGVERMVWVVCSRRRMDDRQHMASQALPSQLFAAAILAGAGQGIDICPDADLDVDQLPDGQPSRHTAGGRR